MTISFNLKSFQRPLKQNTLSYFFDNRWVEAVKPEPLGELGQNMRLS